MERVHSDDKGVTKLLRDGDIDLDAAAVSNPNIFYFKGDFIDEDVVRKFAPNEANAYSASSIHNVKRSEDGFAITEYHACSAVAIQYFKIRPKFK